MYDNLLLAPRWNINTEAERNFATHSALSLEIEDIVYNQMFGKKLFEKVEMKNLSQYLILEKLICPSCLYSFAILRPKV